MSMQATLEIITTEAGFAALEPIWDSLLDQSTTHSPFQAWDYVRLWWSCFREQFQLCIGVAKDPIGRVLGIAPFVIGPDRGESRRHLRHLGFMNGLGEMQGERMDLIVPAGMEAEVSPLLASVISKSAASWDAVRLNKVPEESPNHDLLLAELRRAGAEASVLCRSACRCFDLPASWESFEATKTPNFRRNLRRHWSKLTEENEVSIEIAHEPLLASEQLFRLHGQHWPEGVSSFLSPVSRQIHAALIQKWLPTGRVILPMVVVNHQLAGVVYGLCYKGELFIYQMGWDKRYASVSMGNLSVRVAVMEAIQRGLRLADFLPGEYRYKREWSSFTRTVSDLECLHRWHPRAWLFRLARYLNRRLKAAQNRGLDGTECSQNS